MNISQFIEQGNPLFFLLSILTEFVCFYFGFRLILQVSDRIWESCLYPQVDKCI